MGMRWARNLVRVMKGGAWGNCYYVYMSLWDTAGLLIDNHSKTHMIFSRFVMICSGNFAWSRCCGRLPADGSKGMHSAPVRGWNSGRGHHGLVSCGSG